MAQGMTILSWNVYFRNRELDRAFEFIRNADFDILCLQEVSVEFLARLRTLPFFLAEAIDNDRLLGTVVRDHLVILSKHPITNTNTIAWPDYWPTFGWRAKLFIRFMRIVHWSKTQNRHGLFADITTHGQSLRIFNLHLTITQRDLRLQEFEQAMIEHDRGHATIVCGDFNTIESPWVSLLNWLFGGSIMDAFYYIHERTRIEKHFVTHGLINPLRGRTTHVLARSQLDHILLSRHLAVRDAVVIADRYGSDHYPLCVTVSTLLSDTA